MCSVNPAPMNCRWRTIRPPFVNVVVRILVDANDPEDIAEVNRLQDQVILNLNSDDAYTHPDYDQDSFEAQRMRSWHSAKACPIPPEPLAQSLKSIRSGI